MGGEGATPYEVLLHAAMVGDATRFTRQDGVEQTWRIMQPLLDAPPPVHVYAPGSWGPAEADGLVKGHSRWHEPWLDVVSSATGDEANSPQSAAAPSPFTPIADYAFISDCHTGALVAPDGSVDWLCVPRFDSPERVREPPRSGAGFFRFAPFAIDHPTARHYEPGTNVLITTWKTPRAGSSYAALTMGPWEREDKITPHTRPPADDDADHMLVRTVECLEGSSRSSSSASPSSTMAESRPTWTLVDEIDTWPTPRAPARRSASGPISRSESRAAACGHGMSSRRATGRTARCRGRRSWPVQATSTTRRPASQRPCASGALARPGPHPRPSLARPDTALGACDQGSDVHADRRDGRGADDLASGDAGRRAQLGLPLHVDARHDVHAPGAALPEPRLGGGRVHAVRRRRRSRTRTARCRSCTGSTGAGT